MDGSTTISPVTSNSRQTPNISALCDTLNTPDKGNRLQTAASQPHGPIPLELHIRHTTDKRPTAGR